LKRRLHSPEDLQQIYNDLLEALQAERDFIQSTKNSRSNNMDYQMIDTNTPPLQKLSPPIREAFF
jgi:hypothetical protein